MSLEKSSLLYGQRIIAITKAYLQREGALLDGDAPTAQNTTIPRDLIVRSRLRQHAIHAHAAGRWDLHLITH